MKHIELRPEDYLPATPSREVRERYGIAVVGCGGIARGVHLPAYRKYGFRVTAVCDVVEELAWEAAREFGVGFWTTRLQEVLERGDVDVIDLAVTPEVRLSLVEQIAPSGKAILSQKPLAPTLAEAERIVEVCAEAGVTLMVNQQARWAPAHKAIKVLLDRGVLGHLYSVVHVHRQYQDQPGIKWLSFPDATIVENGIHYVDLSRYFTGRTPERVTAVTAMVPGQNAVSPMIYTMLLEYEPEARLMSTLHFNNIAPATPLHHYLWYLDGTDGSMLLSRVGGLTHGRTELTVSFGGDPGQRQVFDMQGQWNPDAWGGSMAEMLNALEEGREPETSGVDNLDSIRVTNAAVESSKTGWPVEIGRLGR